MPDDLPIPADQHHFDTACDDRPYCVIPSHHDVDALAESGPIPAEVADLRARLEAAERVCYLFGISGARHETEREKAALQAWMDWHGEHGQAAQEVSDAEVQALAARRDAIRNATLARLRGDVDRCPRCGDRLYSPAEAEQHNRDVHNVGPTLTTSWGAEP